MQVENPYLLKEYRGNRSMQEMGEMYGVTAQSWSRWEYGDTYPKMTIMVQLAEDIGCTVPELFAAMNIASKVMTRKGRGKYERKHA